MLSAIGRRLISNLFPNTDTYSAKIDIRKAKSSRQKEETLRAEVLYQPSSQKNMVSRSFAERSLLIPKDELFKEEMLILEWFYKDVYRCKYITKFELSSDRGFNLLFGTSGTYEDTAGIEDQVDQFEHEVDPFEDALKKGRLRKRNSWKRALANPAETIAKRTSFRSRQSSIKTEPSPQPNSTPGTSPILDKDDGETQAGFASPPVAWGEQQSQKAVTIQTAGFNAIGASTNVAVEIDPLDFVPIAVKQQDASDLGRMIASSSARNMGDLTEEVLRNSTHSSEPLERIEQFLESAVEAGRDGSAIGLDGHSVLASVQENDEDDMQNCEQPTIQKSREESLLSDSPPSKHPQATLQTQPKRASDFPKDYWLWNATEKKYYHCDEDTNSIIWYGPLD